MRKFYYIDMDENGNPIEAYITEEEIIYQYFPYWYTMMCKKFGKEVVDSEYRKEDCIKDFCIIHWAEEC